MGYDRNAVYTYARNTWNKVCDDGYVCALGGKKTGQYFGKNKPINSIKVDGRENDCAHFVSRCLSAGRYISIPADGPYKGIAGAPRLVQHLKKHAPRWVEVVEEWLPNNSGAAKKVKALSIGDVVGYSHHKNDNKYEHVVIHIGNGKIVCHTAERWEKAFDDTGLGTFSFLTLLHMKE